MFGSEELSLLEIEALLGASESVRFEGNGRTEVYGWVERLLCHHEYALQKRRIRGLLRAYVERMTGLSRAQTTRLVGVYLKTRPAAVSIGERRKPDPQQRPGFLRIDTVHQGDGPGGKGVYHINAVDEVTQWEIVQATPRISEAYLLPVLQNILRQFPFAIKGFHSDNGSEFINGVVAGLLEKLHIEQTKSRPRQSGDNGLVETKNAAIVRKHIGWGRIDPGHADRLNEFYTGLLNPYVNYHRPSAQPEIEIDARGRKRRLYKQWLTPLEKLLSLDDPQQYLHDGLTVEALQRVAAARSDTDAAKRMQKARAALGEQIQRTA